jgi:DNA-binding response OmpR family regulator
MSRKKILIVDDEADAIRFVEAVLEEIPEVETITSEDGEDGLLKAIENTPDLVILDVMMPGIDGFKVFYELKKNEKTEAIPVIMLTRVADKIGIRFFKDDMKKFMGKAPLDYLEKPLDPERLLKSVRAAISEA